jgi:micrococcal nuclease
MSTRRLRSPRGPSVILWLVVVALVAYRAWESHRAGLEAPPATLADGEYNVERVVDGDTILLANRARVRLIGVNAPESVKPDHPVEPWGPEASQFTHRFLAGGLVRLEFDQERLDQYGRWLAYVWVGDRLLNEELVRAGLARVEFQYSYRSAMKTRFRHAQDEARAAHRGIWSGEPPQHREPPPNPARVPAH